METTASSLLHTIGAPLWTLTWWGRCLPCLEKDEDASARQALTQINQCGQTVHWHVGQEADQSTSGFLGNFFRMGNNNTAAKPAADVVLAKFVVRDSPEDGTPEVWISPRSMEQVGYARSVKLRRIDRAVITDPQSGILTLYAKTSGATAAKVLLQLVLLDTPATGELDASVPPPLNADDRNLFLHHLQVLLEWDKQRRTKLNDGVEEDDEDDEEVNFLQARAQKAAHRANRELELQQTRRSREERKAKLVAASGGLKYTAMAMAAAHDDKD